ncbi:MAG: TRAP transporter substrate-binding protein [Burkholderiaceae bacterium]|nr:TRAP transporter substrate-binding protein [Burkholderiaceae bacterium]
MILKYLGKNLAIAAISSACLLSATAGSAIAAEFTVKVANVMAPSHDTSIAANHFAKLVAEKSEGKIKVQHYPGGQLGSDKETFEAAQQGMLQIASGSSANLVTITRAFEVLHLPFIFDDLDQVHNALNSQKVKDHINAELADVGLRWLFTFDYGFRDINTSEKQVTMPADMAGLKIRASRSPLELAGVKAFGGSAITVDWPEVYNALRFKVVDGEAQPFGTLVSARHHEIIKKTVDVDWQYYGFVGVISTKQWEKYPGWVKEILESAAKESEAYHRQIWAEEDKKAQEVYLKAGGAITELTPDQRAEWIKLGKSTWADSGVAQTTIDLVREAATGK